jgi:hypothetical protein
MCTSFLLCSSVRAQSNSILRFFRTSVVHISNDFLRVNVTFVLGTTGVIVLVIEHNTFDPCNARIRPYAGT